MTDDKLDKTIQNSNHKKGGPYSKAERESRRKQVFDMHFDLNCSAIEIAKSLKINRHTIESDLKYWYSELEIEFSSDRKNLILKYWQRLEKQYNRILGDIKNLGVHSDLGHEKLMFQLNSKMIEILLNIKKSTSKD